MTTTFESAPLATDLLRELQLEEAHTRSRAAEADQLRLRDDGQLMVGHDSWITSDEARRDLARLAYIAEPFFRDLEPDLRAYVFNRRLTRKTPADTPLTIIWKDNRVERIRLGTLALLPRSWAVEAIFAVAPKDVIPNDIRAIKYALNGHVDVSFVTPALRTEPRQGDIVMGGVHLTIEEDGAVQVGPACYRLICLNGALARECMDGRHRIRRREGAAADEHLKAGVRQFAAASWKSWATVASGLKDLAKKPLERDAQTHLVERLRQGPFFISARAAQRVQAWLRQPPPGRDFPSYDPHHLTLYDLHNAITGVGSHDDNAPWRYRYRLRLGAGQLTQRRVKVCRKCQRLLLA